VTPALPSLHDLIARYPPQTIRAQIATLNNEQSLELLYDWGFWARPSQVAPLEFAAGSKTYWLVQAGRGYGKTRVGAEQVRTWARSFRYVNLIGPTLDDARDIMIEGESGILAICPRAERPRYVGRQLLWPSGCKSLIFTADEPERLRGKQHEKLWADELGAWRYAQASWDQAQFGLRLGKAPQAIVTTTPRPTPVIRSLLADPSCIVTRGTSYENRANLAEAFYASIVRRYEGTRLGRQELNAELLDDNPGALWHRAQIDAQRAARAPEAMSRIVVGVDPAVTSSEDSDETGIITVGRANLDKDLKPTKDSHFFVLGDSSLIASPDQWARASIKAYHDNSADRIIGEQNNGGEMVELTIRTADVNVSYKGVTASRGKIIRAEPIAALYEQGRVHHVGFFPQLEDQLCDWDPLTSPRSPDRMDALVWAITDLSENDASGMIDFYKARLAQSAATIATLPQTSPARVVTGFAR
jgi:phage terminase large subunit-like protein